MEHQLKQRPVQKQQQTLAPVLLKSLQLLALPYPSLIRFLESYAMDNPFLEVDVADCVCGLSSARGEIPGARRTGNAPADPVPLFHSGDPMETLHEHLRLQLLSAREDAQVLKAAGHIIAAIDEDGYFREDIAAFAGIICTSAAAAERALSLVQSFTPAGVGARTLKECLLLQTDRTRCDPAVLDVILSAPAEKIARRDLRYFSRLCGVSTQVIQNAFRYLSTLSPQPGSPFAGVRPVHYIYPEIEISAAGQQLEFSFHSGCEAVRVNQPLYEALWNSQDADEEARDYIQKKYQAAAELMQELTLRRNAIEKLMLYLISAQREFFLSPGGKLRPITMKQAAAAIGMNPSTVSRCVNGRYIQTRDGVLPLKDLFSIGYGAEDGAATSSAEVKRRIRRMIEAEPAWAPVTDQAIAAVLAGEGIQISRRTVAKYREQLMIPGSRDRLRKECCK